MSYKLYYWDGLQGRGEFVRLALEEAGAAYVDVVRARGVGEMIAFMEGDLAVPPFAPPFLKDGRVMVSQVANILAYLGPKIGLSPRSEAGRIAANGLQMTITDLVAEVHDTHHPIASGKYYEDQEEEAKARAGDFLRARMPKYLGYFEKVLQRNAHGHVVGDGLTYVDLSLFQVMEGLRYAFPRATKKFGRDYPGLCALAEAVRVRPNIARYLASERRLAFNTSGIFRHYPELDRTAR